MSNETIKVEDEVVVATTNDVIAITTPDNALKALEDTVGVIIGDIGLKVSRVPIEKYKASTQRVDRISFITKSVIAIKTHYIDGAGSVLCFGKKCCEHGIPSVRYLFPVVVYSTDVEGNIAGKKLELKILSSGEDLYKSIITINRATAGTGGIDSVDLLVTCTDDKFQKITLNQAGASAWKKSASAVNFVSEKWANDAEYAYLSVARKVDEETYLSLIGEGVGANVATSQFNENNSDLGKFFED